MSLEDVSARLDATLVEFFTTLDKIYATQNELENVMKDGFFHMAKARYSMGAKSVGALQYNIEEVGQARVHVVSEESDSGETTFHSVIDSTPSNTNTSESSVRKRNIPMSNSDDFVDLANSIQDIQLDTFKSSTNKPSKDPIKWFGLLVPQSLRHSQARFKSAIDLTIELATLESRFQFLQLEYQRMLQEKKTLKAAEDISPNLEEYDFVEKEKDSIEAVK